LQEIYQQYKDRGFTVFSIETTNRPQLAKEFTDKVGATFPIVLDDAKVSDKLFGVTGTPTNLIIDKKGRIYFTSIGYSRGHEKALAAMVEYLLKQS
jgi:peroxiredoxin